MAIKTLSLLRQRLLPHLQPAGSSTSVPTSFMSVELPKIPPPGQGRTNGVPSTTPRAFVQWEFVRNPQRLSLNEYTAGPSVQVRVA